MRIIRMNAKDITNIKNSFLMGSNKETMDDFVIKIMAAAITYNLPVEEVFNEVMTLTKFQLIIKENDGTMEKLKTIQNTLQSLLDKLFSK